jgi:hypothetical protein
MEETARRQALFQASYDSAEERLELERRDAQRQHDNVSVAQGEKVVLVDGLPAALKQRVKRDRRKLTSQPSRLAQDSMSLKSIHEGNEELSSTDPDEDEDDSSLATVSTISDEVEKLQETTEATSSTTTKKTRVKRTYARRCCCISCSMLAAIILFLLAVIVVSMAMLMFAGNNNSGDGGALGGGGGGGVTDPSGSLRGFDPATTPPPLDESSATAEVPSVFATEQRSSIYINAGLDEAFVEDGDGESNQITWLPDADFVTTGKTFQEDRYGCPVPDDVPRELYCTERYFDGSGTYEVPVPPGRYQVVLHFAEMFFEKAEQREFDILLEGELLERMDVAATALEQFGDPHAPVKFTAADEVPVTDGAVTIELRHFLQYPKISALEIHPVE